MAKNAKELVWSLVVIALGMASGAAFVYHHEHSSVATMGLAMVVTVIWVRLWDG